MKNKRLEKHLENSGKALVSELLILPDGNVLVHNLTQTMAAILSGLNPANTTIKPRARTTSAKHSIRLNK